MEFCHVPVMPKESVESLNVRKGGTYFDGTLGGGNHSRLILESAPLVRLIATDLDEEAIKAPEKRLSGFEKQFVLVHDNFKNFLNVISDSGVSEIDGALLDLGVSSYQLDERERGFSYMAENTRLDMRMNREQKLSAFEVVNEYDEKKLAKILKLYGEEKFADKIAKNIALKRKIKPIETTGELVEIIDESIPAKFKRDGHPAKRTFQAIRIEVNGELDGLEQAIRDIVSKLKKGGRIAIITFHSLEDRIVKHTFADLATGCTCDRSLPVCVCGRKEIVKLITKKPLSASESECEQNKRSLSAKLRVAEKL